MDGDKCISTFDVEIYNHFGDMTVTKWGEERACEIPEITAPELESIMIEGTTVIGSYEPDQKAGDSHSEDPPLNPEGSDAGESHDDAGESHDDTEESHDDAKESNDSADVANEENELVDVAVAGTDDDDEVEEEEN